MIVDWECIKSAVKECGSHDFNRGSTAGIQQDFNGYDMAYSGSYRGCICSLAVYVLYHSSHIKSGIYNQPQLMRLLSSAWIQLCTGLQPPILLLKSQNESGLYFKLSLLHRGSQYDQIGIDFEIGPLWNSIETFGAKSFESVVLVSEATWRTDQYIMCI